MTEREEIDEGVDAARPGSTTAGRELVLGQPEIIAWLRLSEPEVVVWLGSQNRGEDDERTVSP